MNTYLGRVSPLSNDEFESFGLSQPFGQPFPESLLENRLLKLNVCVPAEVVDEEENSSGRVTLWICGSDFECSKLWRSVPISPFDRFIL